MLDLSKFKAFAEDKLNTAKMAKSVFDRVETVVGKGKNAGYPFVTTLFSKNLFFMILKSRDSDGYKVNGRKF